MLTGARGASSVAVATGAAATGAAAAGAAVAGTCAKMADAESARIVKRFTWEFLHGFRPPDRRQKVRRI
jgi:hypothetical protein